MAQAHEEPIRLIAVRDTELSVDEVFRAVGHASAGGTALFVGTVRDHDGPSGAEVTALGYSAHPGAEAELRRVAEKVAADFPVRALAAVHRVGDLRVGDLAVVVAVSCPHRAEAFAASPAADRRPQARGADLEAPGVLRRHRGMGGCLRALSAGPGALPRRWPGLTRSNWRSPSIGRPTCGCVTPDPPGTL